MATNRNNIAWAGLEAAFDDLPWGTLEGALEAGDWEPFGAALGRLFSLASGLSPEERGAIESGLKAAVLGSGEQG